MNSVQRSLLCVFLCSVSPLAFAQDNQGAQDTGAGSSTTSPYAPPSTSEGQAVPAGSSFGVSGAGSEYSSPTDNGMQGDVTEQKEMAPVPPASISVPGGYGFIPQTFIPGEGRFAQPPYRVTFSLSQGYDDNVYTAPDHGPTRLPFPGATISTLPKVGSWEDNATLGVQIRLASPRSVLSVDASFGGTYYWHREDENFEYYDNASITYAHQFSSRLQADAQLNIAVAPQPDFSNFNAPSASGANNSNSGEYFLGSVKFDLTYQWAPRFQTISTYSFNTLVYTDGAFGSGDYYQNLLGTQFRFLLSPRLTAVGEYRWGYTLTNQTANDSTSNFLLAGFDYAVSRRLSFTLRAGAELRDYQSGPFDTAPYVETTMQYAYGHGSTIAWTNRYGYEPAGINATMQTGYRTGLAINQAITARIMANFSFNFDRFDTQAVSGASDTQLERDYNLNVGATYALNKNFSLNAYYAFTDVVSTVQFTGYTRNRVFFGATYGF